ncbi:hypothetical protein ABIC60_004937 [Phyllobacterium ifriqiyense]
MIYKRLLHGMKTSVITKKALDRGDRLTLAVRCKGKTCKHAPSLHVDCTSAALAMVAPDLRSGEPNLLTQRVCQRRRRAEDEVMCFTIDDKHSAAWRQIIVGPGARRTTLICRS